MYEEATVYFSDVDGFARVIEFAETPGMVVDALNSLYNCMDEEIEKRDVFKVETVTDIYVVRPLSNFIIITRKGILKKPRSKGHAVSDSERSPPQEWNPARG